MYLILLPRPRLGQNSVPTLQAHRRDPCRAFIGTELVFAGQVPGHSYERCSLCYFSWSLSLSVLHSCALRSRTRVSYLTLGPCLLPSCTTEALSCDLL